MSHLVRRNVIISYFVWLMATRTAKLLPHLWNRPQDIIHVPAFILFGYYFAIMKLYALFTLHEVRFMLLTFYKFFCAQFSNAAFRLVGVLVLVSVTRQPPQPPLITRQLAQVHRQKRNWFLRRRRHDTQSPRLMNMNPSSCRPGMRGDRQRRSTFPVGCTTGILLENMSSGGGTLIIHFLIKRWDSSKHNESHLL